MKYRLAAAALVAQSTMAFAHGIHSEGFGVGFSHPFGGLDHLLTMVLIGLFGVMLGRRMTWAMPLAFVGAMAAGLVIAQLSAPLSWVEIAVMMSPLALGLALLGHHNISRNGALLLAAALGFCHGHVHGTELGGSAILLSTAAGVLLGTAILHALGVGTMIMMRNDLRDRAIRVAGIAASLAGLTLLFT